MKQYKINDKKIEQFVREVCDTLGIEDQQVAESIVQAYEQDQYKVLISNEKLTVTIGIAKKYFELIEEEPLPF